MFAASTTEGSPNPGAFATTLWTGNGSSRSIVTNVDASTSGGMVWIKNRSRDSVHYFIDTVRGNDYALINLLGPFGPDGTKIELSGYSSKFTAFNTNGFSISGGAEFNYLGDKFVAWSFKKKEKFFDVISWTGDGTANRAISHNLNASPGLMLVADKKPSTENYFFVWHKEVTSNAVGEFRSTNFPYPDRVDSISASNIVVSDTSGGIDLNSPGSEYIGYLFGHDTSATGFIQCGKYTGNGEEIGPAVSLGWDPGFLMIMSATTANNRIIIDSARGFSSTSCQVLVENGTVADPFDRTLFYPAKEFNTTYAVPTGAGFQVKSTDAAVNTNGVTYVYMAIRA